MFFLRRRAAHFPLPCTGNFCKPYSVAHVKHGWKVADLAMYVDRDCGNVFFEPQLPQLLLFETQFEMQFWTVSIWSLMSAMWKGKATFKICVIHACFM